MKSKRLVVSIFLLMALPFCGKSPVDDGDVDDGDALQGKLAFISKTDYKLYTQNLDGTNLQRIYLHNIEDNINPDPWSPWLEDSTVFFNLSQLRWSPDGAKLALVVGLYEQSQIVVLDLERGGGGKVASSNWYAVGSPDWSPDGTKITYIMSTSYWFTFTEVFVTDLTTDSLYQITHLSDQVGNLHYPRWDEGVTRIFFIDSAPPDSLLSIYAYSFESDSIEIIATWPAISCISRDGISLYGHELFGGIFCFNIAKNLKTVLTTGSHDFGPRLIDSDRWIIFRRGKYPNYSAWLMTTEGKNSHAVETADAGGYADIDVFYH